MKRRKITYYLSITMFMVGFSFIGQEKAPETNSEGRLKMWLEFTAAQNFHREILLTVDERASDSYDKGFEAVLANDFPNDMYWILDEDKLIIQGIGELSEERVVPIGIKSKGNGPIKITVDTIVNPYPDMEVYLRDNSTMETYDIKNGAFEISLEEGQYNDKYAVVFKPKVEIEEETVLVEEPVLEDEGEVLGVVFEEVISELIIFIGEENNLIKIKRPEEMTINKIAFFNMVGQQLQTWSAHLEAIHIDLPIYAKTGVYVVLLETSKGRILKKVIIK